MTMKLFAVFIGGEHPRANIELHDMRFVVAESIEDTHEELRRQWWGTPESLHIDCWAELTHADGYAITLKDAPATGDKKLFYVNLGGYDPAHFSEMHKNAFVVAETESKAKVRALKTVCHWNAFHKDDLYEAEQTFNIETALQGRQLYVHLDKIEDEGEPSFTCYYKAISKAK